jgi:hypothetical protein
LSFKEIQGLFSKNTEPKGYVLISSVDLRMDGCHRFQREERERGLLHQLRPVAAMASTLSSLESFGSIISDHQSTRNQH